MPKLPAEYRRRIDEIREYQTTSLGMKAPADWDMLVRHAQFHAESTKLAPEPGTAHLTGFGPAEVAKPFPGAATIWATPGLPTTPKRPSRLRTENSFAFGDRRSDKRCALCV